MAKFTAAEWAEVNALLDREGTRFGLPERRQGSVVLASFNIRKLGQVKNRSDGAWAFLARFCERCDLIAVQEVTDDLSGLNHLKGLLGEPYGMVASDITGGVAGKALGMTERLAYLFRWARVGRTEVASDITFDRSAIVDTLYEHRTDFIAALTGRAAELDAWRRDKLEPWEERVRQWEAAGRPGRKPRKPKQPPFVLPHFLAFIRTPHAVSFRIPGADGVEPYDFLAVNAHLLYGDKSKQRLEREMEFFALMRWLVARAAQASRMYHKNMILLGDLNLDFARVDERRAAIEAQLKTLNKGALAGAGRAKVNLPFFDIHPSRAHIADPQRAIWRSTARQSETYDQIAIFIHDKRLPSHRQNATAGSTPDGFDYRVFDFGDLFAEALHGKPLADLAKAQRTALFRRFEHDVSDHLPIWIRLPKPA